MPVSKRQQVVALTQTSSKGRAAKDSLFEEVRNMADEFSHVYLFHVNSMRNAVLQQIRRDIKPGRLLLGKNRVIAKALGTTEAQEYKTGISNVASKLSGAVGLIFTNEGPEALNSTLEQYKQPDFARSGAEATRTVVLAEGPLYRYALPQVYAAEEKESDEEENEEMMNEENDDDVIGMPKDVIIGESEAFPHSMEPQLRKLGMPTTLVKGVVTLYKGYTVCTKGEELSPEQAQILKHLNVMQSQFSIVLDSYYKCENDEDYVFEKIVR